MRLLYNFGLSIYYCGIVVAGFFNKKAELFIKGRKNIFKELAQKISSDDRIVWFHAASLGEFEQGRPVIESFRKKNPDYKILITFFSPSGYEIRKNYSGADFIFYLPFDFRGNAKKFISIVNPELVFFIKYEFWYNYLSILKLRNIKVILFSAIFRREQIFFKWYGAFFRNILQCFHHIFIQDINSRNLLLEAGYDRCTMTGDTRFDRVCDIAENSAEINIVKVFCQKSQIIVAGSTWEKDESLLIEFLNKTDNNLKAIIAPHEIKEQGISRLIKSFKGKAIKFSEATDSNVLDAKLLIIDNIGMLSSLYKYATITYIGGGFGKGIHNILEAAVYGKPVIFGPNYQKFREAVSLKESGGAFSISTFSELENTVEKLLSNQEFLFTTSDISRKFVYSGKGSTNAIISFVNQ